MLLIAVLACRWTTPRCLFNFCLHLQPFECWTDSLLRPLTFHPPFCRVMVYEAGHDEYNDRPGYPPSQGKYLLIFQLVQQRALMTDFSTPPAISAWSGQQRVVKVFNFEPDEAVQASAEVQVQARMLEGMRGRD